jgi:hypothetical protein
MLTSAENDPLFGIAFPNNNSQRNSTTVVTAGTTLPNSGIFSLFAIVVAPILSNLRVTDVQGTWNDQQAMMELIRLRGAVSIQVEIPYNTIFRLRSQSPALTNFFTARLQTNTLDTIRLSEIPDQLSVLDVSGQRRDPHRSFLNYFTQVYLFKLLRRYYSTSPSQFINEGHTIFQVIGSPLIPINRGDAALMYEMADRDLYPSTRAFNEQGEEISALELRLYGGHPQLANPFSIGTRISFLTSVNPEPRERRRLTRTIEHLPNTMVAVLSHMRGPNINRAVIVIFPTRNGSVNIPILPNQVFLLEQGHHFITHDRSGFMFVTLTAYPNLLPENLILQNSQGFIICPPFIRDEDQPNNSAPEIYRSLCNNFRNHVSSPFFNNLRNREHPFLPFTHLDRQHLGPETWLLQVHHYINYLMETRQMYPASHRLRYLRITSDHRILSDIEIPRVTFNFSALLNSASILTSIIMATSLNANDDDTSAEISIINSNIQAQYEITSSPSPQRSQETNVNNDEED